MKRQQTQIYYIQGVLLMETGISALMATEVGDLVLFCDEQGLSSLVMLQSVENNNLLENNTASKMKKLVVAELEQYFSSAKDFNSIPLSPKGTDFQQSVWTELSKIPLGETRTYGQIAKSLNSSARAVGNACRKNPIQIIIPCHRVVSASGIGGYAGEKDGKKLDIKRWLLKHEGVKI